MIVNVYEFCGVERNWYFVMTLSSEKVEEWSTSGY